MRSDFEALKSLHGHRGLYIVFKIYKCNTWLCFNQTHLLKTWILLEEHFKHPTGGFMRQILYKQNIVWSSCLLGTWSLPECSLQIISRNSLVKKLLSHPCQANGQTEEIMTIIIFFQKSKVFLCTRCKDCSNNPNFVKRERKKGDSPHHH